MLAPIIVLLLVVIDASADMLTTSIGLGLGMPEKNRIPRWFFARFGRRYGPMIYFPVEILVIYLLFSILYTITFPTLGSLIATDFIVAVALALIVILVWNNTTHLLQRRKRLAELASRT